MSSSTRPPISSGGHNHGHQRSISTGYVKSPSKSAAELNIRHSHLDDPTLTGQKSAGMSLAAARRLAQRRIDEISVHPGCHINVWNEQGQLVERETVGEYYGQVQSKIYYSLRPDVEGSDEAIVAVDGLGGLLDGGEEVNVREGCTGSWNLQIDAQGKNGMCGKRKERWWHTERGRWREVGLERFF